MKKLVVLSFFFISFLGFSQDADDKEEVKEGWTKSGKITFLINQSAFSNWLAGGENSFAGNLGLDYDINYLKGDWTLDTKILASYGLTKVGDDDVRKTDDRFEINSILGRELKGNWKASFFTNFRTQFTDGYDYQDDFDGDPEDYATSGLFKPAYLSFGPGLLWKKSDNLYVNISPAAVRFTFLSGEVFTYDKDSNSYLSSDDVTTYGVEPGDSSLFEFGFNLRGYYKVELMKNITMENMLSLYSNYLDKPQNVDVNYTMNLDMKINDIFSAVLTFQTIYDDNAFQGFQVREVFGLGVNVNL